MKTWIIAAACSALMALTAAGSASASEPHHARRHAQYPAATATGDLRNAFAFIRAGRDSVPLYGVYPGLVYGGATSAPAGR